MKERFLLGASPASLSLGKNLEQCVRAYHRNLASILDFSFWIEMSDSAILIDGELCHLFLPVRGDTSLDDLMPILASSSNTDYDLTFGSLCDGEILSSCPSC